MDPGEFDVVLLDSIESNSFNTTTVLVTHNHERHIRELKTLKKIYDVRIISGDEETGDSESAAVGDRTEASGISIKILDLEERLTRSKIFRIGNLLFTGNILSAGRIGNSISSEKRALLMADIQEKILAIPEDLLILPSCGPPSTIGAELRWNPNFHPQNQGYGAESSALL